MYFWILLGHQKEYLLGFNNMIMPRLLRYLEGNVGHRFLQWMRAQERFHFLALREAQAQLLTTAWFLDVDGGLSRLLGNILTVSQFSSVDQHNHLSKQHYFIMCLMCIVVTLLTFPCAHSASRGKNQLLHSGWLVLDNAGCVVQVSNPLPSESHFLKCIYLWRTLMSKFPPRGLPYMVAS